MYDKLFTVYDKLLCVITETVLAFVITLRTYVCVWLLCVCDYCVNIYHDYNELGTNFVVWTDELLLYETIGGHLSKPLGGVFVIGCGGETIANCLRNRVVSFP